MRDENRSADWRRRPPESRDAAERVVPIRGFAILFSLLVFLGGASNALAWYKHPLLMPWVVQGLQSGIREKFSAKLPAPCPAEDQKRYQALAKELSLNPQAILPPTSPENCVKGTPITVLQILLGPFTDDPDLGMDRDPPDSEDPNGDRKWMGGLSGPGSQGFRHQYWRGWSWSAPLDTFQIPPRAMGRARERVELMATKAREMFRAGEWIWGARVLSWALHYIQDLSQPFHTDQIPSLHMVPWSALATQAWPPAEIFDGFISSLNHSLTNYHWSYEGYVMHSLSQGAESAFADCLAKADEQVRYAYDLSESPMRLASVIAKASAKMAPEVGYGNYVFFGPKLKTREISLPENRGTPNYREMEVRPDLVQERQLLHTTTCKALANASWASHRLIEWVLVP